MAQQAQLILRHRPLQSEQQAIVDEAWVVGAVRIDDQRAGKRAQVDEMMPVASVARQAGSLDAVDRRHVAGADHRHQPLEAGPFHDARSGPPKIVVDDRHRGEARSLRSVRQVVLAALALQVAHDLGHGRLADVHHGGTAPVVSGDLAAHLPLPS